MPPARFQAAHGATARSTPSASSHREVEWQFDALDLRPVARWLSERSGRESATVEPAGTQDLTDVYLDTDDWRIHRSGHSLRIRALSNRAEATVKSLGGTRAGLRDRFELTEELEGSDPAAVAGSLGPVGRRVASLIGTRPLRPLFEIRNHRQVFALSVDGGAAGEVSLDDTSIPVAGNGRPVRLQRVEVEVNPEVEAIVRPFVEEMAAACGLQPAHTSKFEAGVLATGLAPPDVSDLAAGDLGPEATIGEVAFAALREHFAEFLEHEPGVRMGQDPEEVHDMRVATRRLRAAIALFKEVLPVRFERKRQELGWIAGSLGEVRDLDVQLAQMEQWRDEMPVEDREALSQPLATLGARRDEAHTQLLRDLDSARFARLTSGFMGLLRRGPLRRSPASRTPALVAAPDLIELRFRKVRKAGDAIGEDAPPESFHALRIKAKRLRYALEFLTPLYPKEAPPLIRRLIRLQDVLGEFQDAQVGMHRVREMLDVGEPLDPRAAFMLGRVTERYTAQAAVRAARFPKAYRGLGGKRWKRLRKAMRGRREEVAAAQPHAMSPRPPPAVPA